MPTALPPNLLADPGYLFWAPLLTAVPTNTVVASKFTDAWPVAWIMVGSTQDGHEFGYSQTIEAMSVAEFFDPIQYRMTERAGSFAFAMADWTLSNWKRALNGGALTVVSGTGATQLNKFSPPVPGAEVRCMLGWESLDATVRLICHQTINGGEVKTGFKKAPNYATIACDFKLEKPAASEPFDLYTAGTARA
jgi:hypothetical protein